MAFVCGNRHWAAQSISSCAEDVLHQPVSAEDAGCCFTDLGELESQGKHCASNLAISIITGNPTISPIRRRVTSGYAWLDLELSEMSFLRRLLILALVPLTAWAGMPHLACRCSNGSVRLYCPKLASQMNSDCQRTPHQDAKKSCCTSGKASCCCGASKKASDQESACCGSGCHCTPVLLEQSVSPALKKAVLPVLVQLDLVALLAVPVQLPRITRVDFRALNSEPRVPDDLVILCERWLI